MGCTRTAAAQLATLPESCEASDSDSNSNMATAVDDAAPIAAGIVSAILVLSAVLAATIGYVYRECVKKTWMACRERAKNAWRVCRESAKQALMVCRERVRTAWRAVMRQMT